jgi:uncharacterized protein YdeI (YjbR/CyaY-like superfamily)
MKTVEAKSAAQWRSWLATHHKSASEIWLVFHKKHTGRPCVSYEESVDEALCFGWVDSLVKRIDDERYARKFTPRKADSAWSTANRKRYEVLKAGDRLAPAGVERAPTDRSGDAPRPSRVPVYVERELKRHPQAWSFFDTLPPSYKRKYLAWIDSAKQQETRERRLRQAVALLMASKKPGLTMK